MINARYFSWCSALFAALMLAACGGDATLGGSSGGTLGGGTPGGGTSTPAPAEVRLVLDSNALSADAIAAADGINVIAIVTDRNGVTIQGINVQFSLTPGNGGALAVTRGTTDASGTATAVLTTGGDATFPRQISVQAKAGSITSAPKVVDVVDPAAVVPDLDVNDVQLFANARQLFVDADTSAEGIVLTAVVTDSAGNVVSGVDVGFVLQQGMPAAIQVTRGTTDSTGTATAILTTGGNATPRNVRVEAFTVTPSARLASLLDIPVVARASSVIGTLSSNRLPSDNSLPVTINARAIDANGDPVPNLPISFVVSSGSVSPATVTTNSSGQAPPVTITTGGNATPRIISVTMSAPGAQSDTADIQVVPAIASIRLLSASQNLKADAATVAQGVGLTAILTDAAGNLISGEAVSFSITSGIGALQVVRGTTDAGGTAAATLTTGGDAGFPRSITVTARAQGKSSTVTVNVVNPNTPPPAVEVSAIELFGSAPQLFSDASTASQGITLTALVTNSSGNVVSGVPVSFTVVSGPAAIQVIQGTTDTSGAATATLTTGGNPSPRTITVRATVTANGSSFSDDFSVPVVARAAGLVATLSSTTLPADNSVPVSLVVSARDANGAALANVPVSFAVSTGAVSPASATTNASGQTTPVSITTGGNSTPRTITVTISSPGLAPITATVEVVPSRLIELFASSTQLSSAASDVASGVTLTAVVKDSGQNAVSGASVSFSIISGTGTLTPVRLTTDASGTAQAVLTTGGNPTNRSITVRASAGGSSASVSVTVGGSTLDVSGPLSVQSGVPSTYVATLADSSGRGISGRTVSLSAVNGTVSPTTATTNASGQVTVSLTPTAGPTATLNAAALGLVAAQTVSVTDDSFIITAPASGVEIPLNTPQNVTVTWLRAGVPVPVGTPVSLTTTRGAFALPMPLLTDAAGQVSVDIQAAQAGLARIVAVGNDTSVSPASTPVAELNVEFIATVPASVTVQADPATIGTNQQSTVLAIVRDAANNLVKNATVNFSLNDVTGGTLSAASAVTNSQGRASVVYHSSSTASAQDGVVFTATVTGVPSGQASLTVGSQTARIVLGTGNEIFESDDTTRYDLPYTAIVTDNAGNPAPNAALRMLVVPEFFLKGYYIKPTSGDALQVITAICPSEDVNENGILDPGEDTDNDGILDPSNAASVPLAPPLDENGVASFLVTYPQDRGNWVKVRLTGRARVSGTEATEIVRFRLPISENDADNPPGFVSPFGAVARCDLDDSQVPIIEFTSSSVTAQATEGGGDAVLRITASKTFVEDITIPLFVTPITASGSDYALPATATILAGSLFVDVTLTAADDALVEGDELLVVTLGSPVTSNAVIGARSQSTVTIVDND